MYIVLIYNNISAFFPCFAWWDTENQPWESKIKTRSQFILPALLQVINFWLVSSSIDGTWIVATDSFIAFGTSRMCATHFNLTRELFSPKIFLCKRNLNSKLRRYSRKPSASVICSRCACTQSLGTCKEKERMWNRKKHWKCVWCQRKAYFIIENDQKLSINLLLNKNLHIS